MMVGEPAALEADIAESLEAPVELLPFLPELLQDLPNLSGSVDAGEQVVALLRRAGLPKGARVLDLGCGRGEIAVNIARAFDAEVTGIDRFAAFVEQARRNARAAGLGARCTFRIGDLREALEEPARYDAVLMIALGPVLGDPAATMGALRRVVRDGGLVLIDDAYLDGPPPSAAYASYLDRAATERALEAHGDRILAFLDTTEATAAYNDLALGAQQRRAADLARARPELADALARYLDRQAFETEVLKGPVVPAIWLVRKHGQS